MTLGHPIARLRAAPDLAIPKLLAITERRTPMETAREITKLLRDPAPRVRRSAAEALGKYGPAAPSASDHLGKLTSNPALTHHARVAIAHRGAARSSCKRRRREARSGSASGR